MGGVIINISSKEKKSSAQDWRDVFASLALSLNNKFGTQALASITVFDGNICTKWEGKQVDHVQIFESNVVTSRICRSMRMRSKCADYQRACQGGCRGSGTGL